MKFEKMAEVCKWRVIARESHACKACVRQPNGQECSEDNCAPYQFAKIMVDKIEEEIYHVIGELVEQMEQIESKLNNNNKTMIGFANGMLRKK